VAVAVVVAGAALVAPEAAVPAAHPRSDRAQRRWTAARPAISGGVKILAFAASLRTASLNMKLIARAAQIAREAGADVDLASFREFDMPLYDGDLDARAGLPAGAGELKRRLDGVSAVMMSVPEYNYSIPGILKNAIDWVSRARPMPWRGKSIYLMSASPSPVGGIRGLWQTRIPLEGCGALVFPDMFALANANPAFDDGGRLRDPALAERLQREVVGFVRLAEAVGPLCGHAQAPPPPPSPKRQQEIVSALEDESALQASGEAASRVR
jgi:chromate reductase, NAD(P)H dehydrogenase (quinone)